MNRRIINILYKGVVGVALLVAGFVAVRILFLDSFIVRGSSMEPTLLDGRRIYVGKWVMGPRIYTGFDFDSPDLHCVRLPGLRPLRVGDVAVFNCPEGWERGRIGFKKNYVYAKRCLGCPGDTVRIVGGFFMNGACPVALTGNQILLSETQDSVLIANGVAIRAYRHKLTGWTIRDFGPLWIPRKGDTCILDEFSAQIYARVIRYETGLEPEPGPYTFQEDYYFFVGDNVLDSHDSRYFGLVPARFVVGKVLL